MNTPLPFTYFLKNLPDPSDISKKEEVHMELEDKFAIVTGGANGIGRAICIRLAMEGADIAVADIDMEQATEVVHEVEAVGRKGLALRVDVTKSEEINRMVKQVLEDFGKIDILVNNAGGSARKQNVLFKDSKEEVWDWVIKLNLKGTLLCTRAVINHMLERRSGKIVNISSNAGMIGQIKMADYSAAKAGVIGFTKALAKEVSQHGINVNCVSPAAIQTAALGQFSEEDMAEKKKLSYLNRMGRPEDIACTVAFLASDAASYITGQNIPVMGGRNLGI